MAYNYGNYNLSPVGSGGFGQVYLALKDNDNKAYILKALKEDSINVNNIENLQKEIDIIEKLNNAPQCDYIPTIYEHDKENIKCVENDNNNKIIETLKCRPYYVMDYYSRGTLFHYLEQTENGLLEKHAKVLFKKIVKAIQFCHSRNICHLDIKPSNILFDKKFNPIIIDFGLSDKYRDEKNKVIIYEGYKGTDDYKSPEMWEKYKYKGVESDIFSLGVILFNLVTGKPGFFTSKKNDKYYKLIIYGKDDYESYWSKIKLAINKEFSDEFKKLYVKMVAFHSSDRPSIDKILDSDWLKEINNLNQNEENNLENEVRDVLMKIYDDIKDENNEIQIAEQIEEKGYTTRCDDNDKKEFDYQLKPKKIPNNKININHFLILNENLSAVNFMNSLVNAINENFKDNSFIETSKNSLKFEINFEKEEGENEEVGKEKRGDCTMEIELFKYENGKHLLEFLRTGGEIPDYYHYFLKIKEIIMKYFI